MWLLPIIGLFIALYLIISLSKTLKSLKCVRASRKILFAIAHPDDECMFFGPTLLHFWSHAKELTEVHLLCLSYGNYYKQWKMRKEELLKSCSLLGVPNSNITLIHHSKMPDNPSCLWREDLVASIVLKYIERLSVDTVFTFDKSGISGHQNHISLYNGLNYLVEEGLIPKGCRVYLLETVNIIRKYSIIFDVPFSYFWSQYAFISSFQEANLVQEAMKCHLSQMLWFRKLYILFSRYMFINTYKELVGSSETLKKDA